MVDIDVFMVSWLMGKRRDERGRQGGGKGEERHE